MFLSNKTICLILTGLTLVACGSGGSTSNNAALSRVETEQPNKSNQPQTSTLVQHTLQSASNEQTQKEKSLKPTGTKPPSENPNNRSFPHSLTLYSDEDVFSHLNKNGSYGNSIHSSFVNLILDGKNITLQPISNNIHLGNDYQLHTLRDKEGRLFGYYGYTRVSEEFMNTFNSDEKSIRHHYLPLLEIDSRAESVLPTHNFTYTGNMYYYHIEAPQQAKQADVTAIYQANTKRIAIEISDNNGNVWYIKENRNIDGVNVNEQGKVFGKLYARDGSYGTFDGAIYGQNGEILVGKTQYDDYANSQRNWKGVVGAMGEPTK